MAWGILPKPGTKYRPCKGGCQHRDCVATRIAATTHCRFCLKEIGYGVPFVQTDTGLAHRDCDWDAADAARPAPPNNGVMP